MQHDCPLLTIAIPTYNRSRFLGELLNALAPQLQGRSSVELIISDNASSDDTQALLETFRQKGLPFTSYRNTSNLGADANLLQCFTEARGKYVWIVGDDDVVLEGGVERVLTELAVDEYDLVHLKPHPFREASEIPVSSGMVPAERIEDATAFALKTHIDLTFISANIVNKDRVESLGHADLASLVGTSLVQMGWTYTALGHFRKGLYFREVIVAGRVENTGGYALCEVFGSKLKAITLKWLSDLALQRIMLNGAVQVFFPAMLMALRTTLRGFSKENPHYILKTAFFR